jgi:hypothetical protein
MTKEILKYGLVVGLLLVSQTSYADQAWDMNASWCKAEDPVQKTSLKWQRQPNGQFGYTNIGTLVPPRSVNINCPLAKTTSGPGIGTGMPGSPDDRIKNVSVTLTTSGSTFSNCRVDIRLMSADSSWGNNPPFREDMRAPVNVGVGTSSVYSSSSFSGYWGTATTWAYADLVCSLSVGSSITDYAYTEAGTLQNKMILPASQGGVFVGSGYTFNASGVGVLEALESFGSSFTWGGTVFPDGTSNLQIMTGPSIAGVNASDLTCSFEGQTLTSMLNGTVESRQAYPARVLNFTRTDTFSQDNFSCALLNNGVPTASGDAKIMSYRVF